MPPDATARLPLSFPLDLELTLGGLQRGPAEVKVKKKPEARMKTTVSR